MTMEEKEAIAMAMMAIDLKSDDAKSERRQCLAKLNNYVNRKTVNDLRYALDHLRFLYQVLIDKKAPQKAERIVKEIAPLFQPHLCAAHLCDHPEHEEK